MAKPNATPRAASASTKSLPPYDVIEERVEDQRVRLFRVRNVLAVTRSQLAELAEGPSGDEGPGEGLDSIENCAGTLEICDEVVDGVLEALDSVNLYKAGEVQS